jgi:hypothetical protein
LKNIGITLGRHGLCLCKKDTGRNVNGGIVNEHNDQGVPGGLLSGYRVDDNTECILGHVADFYATMDQKKITHQALDGRFIVR